MNVIPVSHVQYLREVRKYGKDTGVPKAKIMEAWRNGRPKLKHQNWKALAWFDALEFASMNDAA